MLDNSEKLIGIANRLYGCRDRAVFLKGVDGFVELVKKWKPVFDEVMAKEKCNEIEALIVLLKRSKGYDNEGMLMHILTAVGCEISEPKYTKGQSRTRV